MDTQAKTLGAVRNPRLVIGTSVRRARRAALWGDTHFAHDLADAMRPLGWTCQVASLTECEELDPAPATVLLYLRGLHEVPPVRVPTAVWQISHPASLDPAELTDVSLVFSASAQVAAELGCGHVMQATNSARFCPTPDPELQHDLLFVGNSRGERRVSVSYAKQAGLPLQVYGRRWRRVMPTLRVAGWGVANEDLPRHYSNAAVVLNDHWDDMRTYGIVSNRIFDALACGAQVLTDDVDSMDTELRSHLTTFRTFDEFVAAAQRLQAMSVEDRTERGEAARRYVEATHSFTARAAFFDRELRALL